MLASSAITSPPAHLSFTPTPPHLAPPFTPPHHTAPRLHRRRTSLLILQQQLPPNDGSSSDPSSSDPVEDAAYLDELESTLRASASRKRPLVDPGLRLQRALNNNNDGDGRPAALNRRRRRGRPPRFTRESTQLFNLPSTLRGAYDDFLEAPGQPLLLGALSLLVGFYLAGALSTIFGAAGFWEPTVALGPLVVGEVITRRYYSRPAAKRSQTIRLLNALKCGFYFGVVLDALKLAG